MIPASLAILKQLEDCTARWSDATAVSACFETIPLLEDAYFRFAQQCQLVLAELATAEREPDFVALLKQLRRDAPPKTQDMRSYLITPVQRLPRYELLIRELLRCTPPTHCDHAALERILSQIEGVNRNINRRMREAANAQQVVRLTRQFITDPGFHGLTLLREGVVMKRAERTGRLEKRMLVRHA